MDDWGTDSVVNASNYNSERAGKVYLVGAGPGDAELLTLRAVRVLGSADFVLHDALVSAEVLAMVGQTQCWRMSASAAANAQYGRNKFTRE